MGPVVDPETGFIYIRVRYYDPATGQFLTRDPTEASTREPYGYVNGNPLNGTDPSGLRPNPQPTGGGPNGGCSLGYFPDRQSGRCISTSADPPNYVTEPGNAASGAEPLRNSFGHAIAEPTTYAGPFPDATPVLQLLAKYGPAVLGVISLGAGGPAGLVLGLIDAGVSFAGALYEYECKLDDGAKIGASEAILNGLIDVASFVFPGSKLAARLDLAFTIKGTAASAEDLSDRHWRL